jgi:hypothetical protein
MLRRTVLSVCALFIFRPTYADTRAVPEVSKAESKKFFIPRESIRDLGVSRSGAFATDRIWVEGKKVGYMYREKPARKEDSGWRFFAGDEDQAYIDDLSHTQIFAVNTIANYDPDIIPYLDTPAPCAFEKIPGATKYKRVG